MESCEGHIDYGGHTKEEEELNEQASKMDVGDDHTDGEYQSCNEEHEWQVEAERKEDEEGLKKVGRLTGDGSWCRDRRREKCIFFILVTVMRTESLN